MNVDDVINHEDERWFKFVTNCFSAGRLLNLNRSQVTEYICETHHGMGLDANEVPLTYDQTVHDMNLYFELEFPIDPKSQTPYIDRCYQMMKKKFAWDFEDLLISDLTLPMKVGNILCSIVCPYDPNGGDNTITYNADEYNIIEYATGEIATLL